MMNNVPVPRVSVRSTRAVGKQVPIGERLVTQLKHVHPRLDQRPNQIGERGFGGPAVDEDVQSGLSQSLAALRRDRDRARQGVGPVPQRFQFCGQFR